MQILSNLKESFWPFQQNQSRSLFLRAADVANCSDRSNATEERYFNYLNQQDSLLLEKYVLPSNLLASSKSPFNYSLHWSPPPLPISACRYVY